MSAETAPAQDAAAVDSSNVDASRFLGGTSYTQGHGIESANGTTWSLGTYYKARFDRGGIEFTPALGAGASQNYPWRFTFESIRRGDQLIEAPAQGQAVADGDLVKYVRV